MLEITCAILAVTVILGIFFHRRDQKKIRELESIRRESEQKLLDVDLDKVNWEREMAEEKVLSLQGEIQDAEAKLRVKKRALESMDYEERVVIETAKAEAAERVKALDTISELNIELLALKNRCVELREDVGIASGFLGHGVVFTEEIGVVIATHRIPLDILSAFPDHPYVAAVIAARLHGEN